ncbi:hypothetical protein EDD22DRAFT_951216 [Suillus occidentalis]|nr:hypothetical protein EDD22DRAFT_951216 [Suillus occidentalis]
MSLCATPCVEIPRFGSSTPLQCPSTSSHTSVSPGGSAASTVSESDDDSSPLTPVSKRSGSRRIARAQMPTSSRYDKHHHADTYDCSYHPYRRIPSFQRRHLFECLLNSFNRDTLVQDTKNENNDEFVKHMDALGPQSFRLIVHYKEAVRERQRLDFFVAYWAREESKRLDTLRQFLLEATREDFVQAEREAAVLLQRLLEKHPPATTEINAEVFAKLNECNKKSLNRTDAQLDLLKARIRQNTKARYSPDNNSDAT